MARFQLAFAVSIALATAPVAAHAQHLFHRHGHCVRVPVAMVGVQPQILTGSSGVITGSSFLPGVVGVPGVTGSSGFVTGSAFTPMVVGTPQIVTGSSGVTGSSFFTIDANQALNRVLNRFVAPSTVDTSGLQSQLTTLTAKVDALDVKVTQIQTLLGGGTTTTTAVVPAAGAGGFQVDTVGNSGGGFTFVSGSSGGVTGSSGAVAGSAGAVVPTVAVSTLASPDDLRRMADRIDLARKFNQIETLKVAYEQAKAAKAPQPSLDALKNAINLLIDDVGAASKVE